MKAYQTVTEIVDMLRKRMRNHVKTCDHAECQFVDYQLSDVPYICYSHELFFEYDTVTDRTHCHVGCELNQVMQQIEKYHEKGGELITVSILQCRAN